jgi:tetratricopeptide (TPR) repeat protein
MDPAAHYNLGNVYYEKGVQDPEFFEKALGEYTKSSQHHPDDLRSQNNIADCLLRLGKVKKARKQIKKVLAEHPDYLPAHCTLGEIFSREGNLEAAVGEFEMVLALEERETGILHKYAGQHLIEELSELSLRNPSDPQVRLRMGRAYKVLGLAYGDMAYMEKAVEEFKQAGGVGIPVFLELAETYIRLRKFDVALGALDAALNEEPENITALSFKAEVFSRLGDRDRTIGLLRAIRKQAFT